MPENISKRKWLRPLDVVARSIVFAWLFWLWWIGLRSLYPDDEEVRDMWNIRKLIIYLELTIIFGLFGLSLAAIWRS